MVGLENTSRILASYAQKSSHKLTRTQIGLDGDRTPTQQILFAKKWKKMKELWKLGKNTLGTTT